MTDKTILLVEDNPDDELLAILALRENGITNPIVVTRDGQEALDWLFGAGAYADRDPHETPGIILLDIHLPKLDGLEVLRRLRDFEPTKLVPVVMYTASREQEELIRSYAWGANTLIRKPTSGDNFVKALAVVKEILEWPAPNK